MRIRNSYANVASTFALLVAVSGGAAVAAGELGNNTVGTKQLKNNAVVSKKVTDGSLQAADFAAGQLTAGPAGPAGPQGPKGAQGVQGIRGVPGNTGAPGANAASYVGYLPIGGSLAAYTCYGANAVASEFKVGDSAIFAPGYGGATPAIPYSIQVTVGQSVVAGNILYSLCNISGATVTLGAGAQIYVYRIVGPNGPRPGPEDRLAGSRLD